MNCSDNLPIQDLWVKRIAVWALSFTVVLCAGGAIWLGIPDLLTALGTGALEIVGILLLRAPIMRFLGNEDVVQSETKKLIDFKPKPDSLEGGTNQG